MEVACYVAVRRDAGRLLFRRRGEAGLNAGLWELPTTEWHGGEPSGAEARTRLGGLAAELGQRWSVGEPLAAISHGITNHRVRFVAYEVDGDRGGDESLRWGNAREAESWGLTAATRKILGKLPTLV